MRIVWVARRAVEGRGRKFAPGEVVDNVVSWPSFRSLVGVGAIEARTMGADGALLPAMYVARRIVETGGKRWLKGQIVEGVQAWGSFRRLLSAKFIQLATDADLERITAPRVPASAPSKRRRSASSEIQTAESKS